MVGGSTLRGAAFTPDDPQFAGRAIVDFDAFDEWREEDDLLVGHARDPFKTIDTRHSSRHVVVEIAGTTVADSTRSTMLFETYLPTRYYFPPEDVRMELLSPSATTTVCAYKGQAAYWSATIDGVVVPDVAWSYPDPHNYAVAVGDQVDVPQRARGHQRGRAAPRAPAHTVVSARPGGQGPGIASGDGAPPVHRGRSARWTARRAC